jgi:hypothetical protein
VNLLAGGVEYAGPVKWLAPFVGQQNLARELLTRPTGWHLAYLLSLTATVGCVAMLRHGADRRLGTVAAVSVLVVVIAGGAQLRAVGADPAPSDSDQQVAAGDQDCVRQRSAVYCAVPGYEPWIDPWRAIVERVADRLPREADIDGLTVRQGLEPATASGGPSGSWTVRPGMWWGRGAGEGQFQLGLALAVAAGAVEIEPDAVEGDGHDAGSAVGTVCSLEGQARAVVVLWLGGQVSEQSAASLREAVRRQVDDDGRSVDPSLPDIVTFGWRPGEPVTTLEFHGREGAAALQLLERPVEEVAGDLEAHWAELTAPGATTDDAIATLDLDGRRLPAPGLAERPTGEPGGWTSEPCR